MQTTDAPPTNMQRSESNISSLSFLKFLHFKETLREPISSKERAGKVILFIILQLVEQQVYFPLHTEHLTRLRLLGLLITDSPPSITLFLFLRSTL
jgi:hypothetical protein